jgi:hypothetical protein
MTRALVADKRCASSLRLRAEENKDRREEIYDSQQPRATLDRYCHAIALDACSEAPSTTPGDRRLLLDLCKMVLLPNDSDAFALIARLPRSPVPPLQTPGDRDGNSAIKTVPRNRWNRLPIRPERINCQFASCSRLSTFPAAL